MKKVTLTSFLLCMLFCSALSAQFVVENISPTEAQLIRDRKLIVLLVEPNPTDTAIFYKKGETTELVKLKQLCSNFNQALKKVIATRWTLHQTVEFITPENYKNNYAKNGKEYIVMRFSSGANSQYIDFNTGYNKVEKKLAAYKNLFITPQTPSYLGFSKGENWMGNFIYEFPLPESTPGYFSVVAAVGLNDFFLRSILQKDEKLSRREIEDIIIAKSPNLASKTLLVGNDWKPEEFDLEAMKKIYPYPIKMVNETELSEAIDSKAPDLAWHLVLPIVEYDKSSISTHTYVSYSYMHFFIDNNNGEPLMVMNPYLNGPLNYKKRQDRFLNEEILKIMAGLLKKT